MVSPEVGAKMKQGYDVTFSRVKDIFGTRLVANTHRPFDVEHIIEFYKEHGDEWPCKCERGAECMKPRERE